MHVLTGKLLICLAAFLCTPHQEDAPIQVHVLQRHLGKAFFVHAVDLDLESDCRQTPKTWTVISRIGAYFLIHDPAGNTTTGLKPTDLAGGQWRFYRLAPFRDPRFRVQGIHKEQGVQQRSIGIRVTPTTESNRFEVCTCEFRNGFIQLTTIGRTWITTDEVAMIPIYADGEKDYCEVVQIGVSVADENQGK